MKGMVLDVKHYATPVRRRISEPLIERIEYCRAMLHMYGILRDSENLRCVEKVERIRKALDEGSNS